MRGLAFALYVQLYHTKTAPAGVGVLCDNSAVAPAPIEDIAPPAPAPAHVEQPTPAQGAAANTVKDWAVENERNRKNGLRLASSGDMALQSLWMRYTIPPIEYLLGVRVKDGDGVVGDLRAAAEHGPYQHGAGRALTRPSVAASPGRNLAHG